MPTDLSPELLEYLQQASERQKAQQNPDYLQAQARQRNQDFEANLAPQTVAAYAKAFSQLGTLGGKSADTSMLNEQAKAINQQQAMQHQQRQQDQDDLDKQTGLRMKTLEYLQSRNDRQNEMAMSDQRARELADISDKRARDLAQMSDDRAFALEKLREENATKLAGGKVDTKEPNKDQFTAAGFGKRLEQSDQIMQNLAQGGYNRANASEGLVDWLPGVIQPSKFKEQEQAERNFVNAVLRRESGAAISPSEFDSAQKQYFPRPGDTPAVLAQKDQNRKQAIASFKAEGGRAWEKIPDVPLSSPRNPASEGTAYAASPSMDASKVRVISPEGKPGSIPKEKLEEALSRGFKQVE